MNMMDEKQLTAKWDAIYQGAGKAIDWVNAVRGNAPRLNTEADSLIYRLRRSRNMAKNLSLATQRPMSVGFFGLSQAGKSYLISALAAGQEGRLRTSMSGKTLDFIDHINPPGGGKEATGLVTRFSRNATKGTQAFPVELHLFSEIEIVKILANAYLYDFNQEKIDFELDEEKISRLIKSLSTQRSATPVAGITHDDVVSLWDYLQRHAEKSQKKLATTYWPKAIELAPYLSIAQRAKLFSVLWGDIAELTSAYQRFSTTLASLGNAPLVLAPLSSLVKEQDGVLVQNDSIMNVDMLERLNTANDSQISICPVHGDRIDTPVTLSLAELTALTVELVVPLLDAPSKTLFEQVELLDFPGYRGRLGVETMADVRRQVNDDSANPLAQLILRGKVAYLFERYTDNQEMNVLVVCTASNKQSDVKEVGAVLTEWINNTQGKDAQTRAKRPSGLIWAMTMFDMRITNSLTMNEALLRQSWGKGGMIKMAMLERFGQYEWMSSDWINGEAFNNTFLVRKPGVPTPFIQISNGKETVLNEDSVSQLHLMKKTFAEDETVQRYIREPDQAWDAMLSLNDGGMQRLADYLETVALKSLKLERISEQLQEIQRDLIGHHLEKWYQSGGEEELQVKRRNAATILRFMQSRPYLQGALLDYLLPSRKSLYDLYMQEKEVVDTLSDNKKATQAPVSAFAAMEQPTFDLFSDAPISLVPEEDEAPKGHGNEVTYPKKVMALWINHLRSLPDNNTLLTYLGIDQEIMVLLVDELITAINRLGVEQRMLKTLAGTEAIARRDDLAEQQSSRVYNVLGDFITWFNFKDNGVEKPDSKINVGHKIFERPDNTSVQWGDDERLVRLPTNPVNYTLLFVIDWLIALSAVITENAGHSAGREISAEQNAQLGQIIQTMKSSVVES
ncbi:putative virulence factor [Proteus penneri]|uniref:putative virulence factor n=2 Tax=Proteus penneri TaxID=102862 RepID=UPI0028890B3E|nr:virulence factor SrfC family protein [Proteus penneri]